jgi:polysaccharide biosynthesis transport protein
METQTNTQPRLADYVRPLTSRWWLILAAVVVATGGVYAYYVRKPNVYTASTIVYVTQPGNPVTGVQAAAPTDRDVADAAALLASNQNAAAVARRIGYSGSPQSLLASVDITSKQNEDFVQVSAQSASATEAAAIVNGFAHQFVTSLTNAYTTQIGDAIHTAKQQLGQAPPGVAGEVARSDLTNQLYTLEQEQAVPTTIAEQVNSAPVPATPTSPKPVRNALFALLLSLVGAIAVAYGLERFDRRLKDPEDMEAAYGAPLLAVLPHTDAPAPVLAGEPVLGSDFREPFRVLRTNIELASVDAPPRTIVISSAMPGEGKSTVVRNLALAFRETGKRVAVVDLDLRNPALARLFEVPLTAGITDVLRRDTTLDAASLQIGSGLPTFDELVEASSGDTKRTGSKNGVSNGHNGSSPHGAGLTLLLGGARPANPPAVLASDRVTQVLDELREHYDLVLIDSAPVLAVTDTVPLLRYADAALFVGRLGVTTRDTAKRLIEFLDRVPGVNTLGIVANDLSRLEAGAYGYGYGYGYPTQEPKRRRRRAAAEAPKQPV